MGKLTLTLKKKWFDMIQSGVKLEEYREIKQFWVTRLTINFADDFDLIERGEIEPTLQYFERLVFTLGYPKADDASRHLVLQNPKIRVGTGRTEWGAEPNKKYFIISWEK